MSKSTFFTGQPILNQLIKLIPNALIRDLSIKHNTDRYCKKFMTRDHLISMLYAGFHKSTSIRELITGLQANSSRLSHLGFKHTPRRSTLSDANKRRSEAFFGDLYHALYEMYFLPDSRSKKDMIYLLDSTTMSLFSNVMAGAGSYRANGKKKGGAKAHVLLDAHYQTPSFVRITESKEHDLTVLDHLDITEGSTVVFDKAYIKHKQFNQWTEQEIRWVTRTKTDASVQELEVLDFDKESEKAGVRNNRIIRLGRPSNENKTPLVKAREVWFWDKKGNREFRFITNDFSSRPEQIAQLYKDRWQIEMVFKRIKQAFPLKYFLGDNPNAIKIQIWSALICDLLIQIIRHQLKKKADKTWAYANLASMIRHHLMTYIDLIAFLTNPEKSLLNYKPPDPIQYQLNF